MTKLSKVLVTTLCVLSLTLSYLTFYNEAENDRHRMNQILFAYQVGCYEGTSSLYASMVRDPLLYQFHCVNIYKGRDKDQLKDIVEKLEANLSEQSEK